MKKKLETGDFVVPGDILGVEEEFMPGENAFVEDGFIYSSATGKVQFDDKARRVSVFPTCPLPPKPAKGDSVIGRISYIRGQFAHMDIVFVEGETNREIPAAPEGAIHISQARKNYVKDLTDQFQIGDVVRAKVINPNREPMILSTVGDEYGVVLAKCKLCRTPLTLKGRRLYCEVCDRYENRKFSTMYGMPLP